MTASVESAPPAAVGGHAHGAIWRRRIATPVNPAPPSTSTPSTTSQPGRQERTAAAAQPPAQLADLGVQRLLDARPRSCVYSLDLGRHRLERGAQLGGRIVVRQPCVVGAIGDGAARARPPRPSSPPGPHSAPSAHTIPSTIKRLRIGRNVIGSSTAGRHHSPRSELVFRVACSAPCDRPARSKPAPESSLPPCCWRR